MAVDREPAAVSGPLRHDVGPGGTVVVAVEADDVRIRGVDGTEARIVSPADGVGLETAAEAGRFVVRSERAARYATFGLRIGGHGIGMTIAGSIEVEVPRDARVEVRTAAGDVSVRDVRGGSSVKSSSGDVSLKRVAGPIAVGVASGDTLVEAVAPIALEVRSISGDVRVRAPLVERLAAETVSGDVHVSGTLASGVGHAISTVSGGVDLDIAGGLTLTARTVSGQVDCRHPDRRSGDGRRQPLVIGDGGAHLAIRTMSGDVEVRAAAAAAVGLPATPVPPPPTAPPSPPEPAVPPFPAPPPSIAPSPLDAPTQPAGRGDQPGREPTLDVLEALARGEIDVLEAERRLAAVPSPDRHHAEDGHHG
jgi:hypothetical protein